jgi:hypothetical protein
MINRQFGESHYVSSRIEDLAQGFVGVELIRTRGDKKACIAKIVF